MHLVLKSYATFKTEGMLEPPEVLGQLSAYATELSTGSDYLVLLDTRSIKGYALERKLKML